MLLPSFQLFYSEVRYTLLLSFNFRIFDSWLIPSLPSPSLPLLTPPLPYNLIDDVTLYETLHFSEVKASWYLYERFVNKSKYSMILNLTDQNKLGFLAEFLFIGINFKWFLRELWGEKRFFQKLWDLLSDLNLNIHHRVGTELLCRKYNLKTNVQI